MNLPDPQPGQRPDADTTTAAGSHGHGQAVPFDRGDPKAAQTCCLWLITSPGWHPAWSQYLLAVVKLDDLDGWPVPHRHFAGATHEMTVFAVDPAVSLTVDELGPGGNPSMLAPVNHVVQFEASDREMCELAAWCVWGVVNGHLNPEPANRPTRIREAWLTSCVKTLAHIRGEAHQP